MYIYNLYFFNEIEIPLISLSGRHKQRSEPISARYLTQDEM